MFNKCQDFLNISFTIIVGILFLCGCGAGSIYGPGYYSETKVGNDVQQGDFSIPRGGDHPVTGDLCLLRCAEVTLNSFGNSYFQVVDSESGSSIDQMPSLPIPFINTTTWMILSCMTLLLSPRLSACSNQKRITDFPTMPLSKKSEADSMRHKYDIQ